MFRTGGLFSLLVSILCQALRRSYVHEVTAEVSLAEQLLFKACGGNKRIGYCGMTPPDADHVYTLRIFALDTVLDIENGFDMNVMFRKMRGHILAQAELEGLYSKM